MPDLIFKKSIKTFFNSKNKSVIKSGGLDLYLWLNIKIVSHLRRVAKFQVIWTSTGSRSKIYQQFVKFKLKI